MKIQRTPEEQAAIDAYFANGGLVKRILPGNRIQYETRNGMVIAFDRMAMTEKNEKATLREGFEIKDGNLSLITH